MPEEKWKTFFLPKGLLPGDPLYFISYRRAARDEFLRQLDDPKARRQLSTRTRRSACARSGSPSPTSRRRARPTSRSGSLASATSAIRAARRSRAVFGAGLGEIWLLAPSAPDGKIAALPARAGGPGIMGITLAAGQRSDRRDASSRRAPAPRCRRTRVSSERAFASDPSSPWESGSSSPSSRDEGAQRSAPTEGRRTSPSSRPSTRTTTRSPRRRAETLKLRRRFRSPRRSTPAPPEDHAFAGRHVAVVARSCTPTSLVQAVAHASETQANGAHVCW